MYYSLDQSWPHNSSNKPFLSSSGVEKIFLYKDETLLNNLSFTTIQSILVIYIF